MYLQKLYQQHKGWFVIIILFITGQLFINYKRGVVISPFYHYGMYAESLEKIDTLKVFELTANEKTISPFKVSAQQWDKLMLPLWYYPIIEYHNNNYFKNDIERLMNKINIHPDTTNFYTSREPNKFLVWYKQYVASVINTSIDSIQINYITTTPIITQNSVQLKRTNAISFSKLCQ